MAVQRKRKPSVSVPQRYFSLLQRMARTIRMVALAKAEAFAASWCRYHSWESLPSWLEIGTPLELHDDVIRLFLAGPDKHLPGSRWPASEEERRQGVPVRSADFYFLLADWQNASLGNVREVYSTERRCYVLAVWREAVNYLRDYWDLDCPDETKKAA